MQLVENRSRKRNTALSEAETSIVGTRAPGEVRPYLRAFPTYRETLLVPLPNLAKELGIGGIAGEEEGAFFVYRKDAKNNILYVAKEKDEILLQSTSCVVDGVNWIGDKPEGRIEVGVKFRYRQPDQFATLAFQGEKVVLEYPQGVKAVTPGQIAVFYLGERMLGGGIIDEVYRGEERID